MINFIKKNYRNILVAAVLNILLILFVYRGVFSLELQGDTWQYAWGYVVAYGDTLFNQDSWRNLHTSLAGSYLAFALIKDHFGLSGVAYYSISVILKFFTVMAFYFLIKKLTNNILASLIATLLLSASFAGVEATHWVFNMYAYIGLVFILLSVLTGLNLPNDFKFKKWLISFSLACAGVWYATMRTNGIIPIIIIWSAYKAITLKSKDSIKNLVYWVIGLAVFIAVDHFFLGQMESGYSQYYIIGEGLKSFHYQLAQNKYDFLLSPATNLGITILPDVTWGAFNFPQIFSFLGGTMFQAVMFPSFLIFTFFSWIISKLIPQGKNKFILFSLFGLGWTLFLFFISKLGPLNFSSWVNMTTTLFGGYFMILCLVLAFEKAIPSLLRDLFGLTFLWSFMFLLLPEFQNGGPVLGTYHRYMVTTAPAVALFLGGIISLSYLHKNHKGNFLRVSVLLLSIFLIFNHAFQTQAFFDRKALVHNKVLSDKIWQQFSEIVPNKPSYMKNDDPRFDLTGPGRAPILWFETSGSSVDSETLFETLFFGFLFRASIKYGWYPHSGTGLYYQNYADLIKEIRNNPKLLDDFYAMRMENQRLIDITKEAKERINMDLQK